MVLSVFSFHEKTGAFLQTLEISNIMSVFARKVNCQSLRKSSNQQFSQKNYSRNSDIRPFFFLEWKKDSSWNKMPKLGWNCLTKIRGLEIIVSF